VCVFVLASVYTCVNSELFSAIFFQNHYNKLTFQSGASPNYVGSKCMIKVMKIVFGQEFVDEEKKNRAFIRLPNTLYYFFWAIPRSLNFMSQRFGKLSRFHLHRWCQQEESFNNCYGFQKINPYPVNVENMVSS